MTDHFLADLAGFDPDTHTLLGLSVNDQEALLKISLGGQEAILSPEEISELANKLVEVRDQLVMAKQVRDIFERTIIFDEVADRVFALVQVRDFGRDGETEDNMYVGGNYARVVAAMIETPPEDRDSYWNVEVWDDGVQTYLATYHYGFFAMGENPHLMEVPR